MTKQIFFISEKRVIYKTDVPISNPKYALQLSKKSEGWAKPQLNSLHEKIFKDNKLSLQEAKSLLSNAKAIHWKKDGNVAHVAALQTALKHLSILQKNSKFKLDPGNIDAVLLQGKKKAKNDSIGGNTKRAVWEFQELWNSVEGNRKITVDGEPGPETINALLVMLNISKVVPQQAVTQQQVEPKQATQQVTIPKTLDLSKNIPDIPAGKSQNININVGGSSRTLTLHAPKDEVKTITLHAPKDRELNEISIINNTLTFDIDYRWNNETASLGISKITGQLSFINDGGVYSRRKNINDDYDAVINEGKIKIVPKKKEYASLEPGTNLAPQNQIVQQNTQEAETSKNIPDIPAGGSQNINIKVGNEVKTIRLHAPKDRELNQISIINNILTFDIDERWDTTVKLAIHKDEQNLVKINNLDGNSKSIAKRINLNTEYDAAVEGNNIRIISPENKTTLSAKRSYGEVQERVAEERRKQSESDETLTQNISITLGDLTSNSRLNEPLDATIHLVTDASVEELNAANAQFKLAPSSVFIRLGVDRPDFLDNLIFEIKEENGKSVVKVTSTVPMTEPFVNFLLEATWNKGQLLKEYTIMLDPPVVNGNPLNQEIITLTNENGALRTRISDLVKSINSKNNLIAVRNEQVQDATNQLNELQGKAVTNKKFPVVKVTALPVKEGMNVAEKKEEQTALTQEISNLESTLRKKNRLIALRDDRLAQIGKDIEEAEKEKTKGVKPPASKNTTMQLQQEPIDL